MLYISFVNNEIYQIGNCTKSLEFRIPEPVNFREDVWYSVGSLTAMKHAEMNNCEPTYECHFPIRSRSVEEGKKLWAFLL